MNKEKRPSIENPILTLSEAAGSTNQKQSLKKIAELAVIKLSGSQDVIDLANEAAVSDSQTNKADLHKKIQSFYETAECKNVEEAIQKNEEMINAIDEMIKNQNKVINTINIPKRK